MREPAAKSFDTSATPFVLDGVEVDPIAGEIRRAGAPPVRLEPKVMAVLACLARRSRKIVTKEEIREEVWDGAIVVDEALQRIISLLRKALEDNPRAPTFIETIPKKGYRLLVEPRFDGSPGHQAAPAAFAPRPLRRLRSPAIAGAASAIALAVAAVIAGGPGSSPLAEMQPATSDALTRADALYGRYRYEDNENAIVLYRAAIENAPAAGRPHAGLANALAQRYFMWTGRQSDLKEAVALARKAVRLAPDDPSAHKALGLALEYGGDFDRSVDSYLAALELEPQHWPSMVNVGDIHYRLGEYRLARNWFARAHEIADNRVMTASKLGKAAMALGRYEEARDWFAFILDHHPLHQAATAALARAEFYRGDEDAAMERCAALLSRLPDDPLCGVARTDMLMAQGRWAQASAALEAFAADVPPKWADYVDFRRSHIAYRQNATSGDELHAFIARTESAGEGNHTDRRYWTLAAAYSILGDRDKGLSYLKAARAAGWSDWAWDMREPAFESLRGDERFAVYPAGY